ncbi:hypothetical protein V6N11_007657 [Hibiscus sabdariffa]|uniref:Uncharacterized protein n=1 Tax=Hibiscus sabdariffa TaxID=183260 RepID=A0ABR2NJ11_9ROSI
MGRAERSSLSISHPLSCGGLGRKYLKWPGLIRNNRSTNETMALVSVAAVVSRSRSQLFPSLLPARSGMFLPQGTIANVVTTLGPIISLISVVLVRYEEIISDPIYLDGVLAEGATKVAAIADAALESKPVVAFSAYRVHGGILISMGACDTKTNIDPPSESQNQQSIFSSISTCPQPFSSTKEKI